jgi:hypothetical protein
MSLSKFGAAWRHSMNLPVASTLAILNQPPFVAPKMYVLASSLYGTSTCLVFSFVTNVPNLTQFPGHAASDDVETRGRRE